MGAITPTGINLNTSEQRLCYLEDALRHGQLCNLISLAPYPFPCIAIVATTICLFIPLCTSAGFIQSSCLVPTRDERSDGTSPETKLERQPEVLRRGYRTRGLGPKSSHESYTHTHWRVASESVMLASPLYKPKPTYTTEAPRRQRAAAMMRCRPCAAEGLRGTR